MRVEMEDILALKNERIEIRLIEPLIIIGWRKCNSQFSGKIDKYLAWEAVTA